MSNKRLLKELQRLIIQQRNKPLLENDYLVAFDEENINTVFAIIKAPYDSVYRHKFIKLNFEIPPDYPFSPPIVTFVNYDSVRIHPNMYEDSKCCSTILNTWPSENEKWTSSMGIETILLTFHSFLDNEPYRHEPGGHNDESYTIYVLFQTWNSCLIRYLENYNSQPELFTTFISNYLLLNINPIITELNYLNEYYIPDVYETNCFYIGFYTINYNIITRKLIEWYNFIDYKENIEQNDNGIDYSTFINTDYKCNICFDTKENKKYIKLSCNHNFHVSCLCQHIKNNGNICSLCRTTINIQDSLIIKNSEWIINPDTKRRVKIGSRTYLRLIDEGIISIS